MKTLNFSSSAISQPSFKGCSQRSIYSKKDMEVNRLFINKLHEIVNNKTLSDETSDLFDKGFAYKTGGMFTNMGLNLSCDKQTPANYAYSFSNDPGVGIKDYGVTISRYATNEDRELLKNPLEQIDMSFSKDPAKKAYNFLISSRSKDETRSIFFDTKNKLGIMKNFDLNNPVEVSKVKKFLAEALEDAKIHKSSDVPKRVFKELKKGIDLLG